MTDLCIIADDLTGACDTGAAFAQHGRETHVVLDAERAADDTNAAVLVYTTESRHLPCEQAVQAVQAVRRVPLHPQATVYKKIDSTLRGHPGAELAALMDALGAQRALVAPAFPAQGRTVRDGRLYVGGLPLEHTPFAAEAGSGDLRVAFGGRGHVVRHISLEEARQNSAAVAARLRDNGIFIADAETDADLGILASAVHASCTRLLCGSAGLARALAGQGAPPVVPLQRVRRSGAVLVIAGSRHPATVRQVEMARHAGCAVITAPAEFLTAAVSNSISFAQAAMAALNGGYDVILTTPGRADSPLGKDTVAQRFGALAAQVLAQSDVMALTLTGGDIAAAVCAALGAHGLRLRSELQPGIALGELAGGAHAGLPVVTKAGGFGDNRALADIVAALRQS